MSEATHIDPSIICPCCGAGLNLDDDIFVSFLSKFSFVCGICNNSIDFWESVVKTVATKDIFATPVFFLIGAHWTFFDVKIHPNELIKIEFFSYGVPKDAIILNFRYIGVTNGEYAPVTVQEIQGDGPIRHTIPSSVFLYGIPLGEGSHGETNVGVSVTWISHNKDDVSRMNLIDAFQLYETGQYERAVIPANVAVEIKLTRLLTSFFERSTNKKGKEIRSFLQAQATYKYQLDILLPSLVALINGPSPSEKVQNALIELNMLRNQVAHNGRFKNTVTKDKMAECLCGALCGFHYIDLVESLFQSR